MSQSVVIQSIYFLGLDLTSMQDQDFQARILHRDRLQQERAQVQDQREALLVKDIKKAQLQDSFHHVQEPGQAKRKLTEDATQCSFDEDGPEEKNESLRRLSEVLTYREQEGIKLHLAVKNLEQENEELREALAGKVDLAHELRNRIQDLQGYLSVSMKDFQYLCNENKGLREKVIVLEKDKRDTQQQLSELQSQAEKWQELKTQKEMIMNQRIKMQYQENMCLRERQASLKEQLQMQTSQLEKVKEGLNTYDWKLFCLETELDLWAKECKQLKYTNERLSLKLNQVETALKEKQIVIFTAEEENRILEDSNQSLTTQLKRKQAKIDVLLADIDDLQTQLSQTQESKEMSYILKEKDEELKQIMIYLKEKISELDQVKYKNITLERQLQEEKKINEGLKQETYEMEQNLIEAEESIFKLQTRVQELENCLKSANKQINDHSLIQILRKGQWTELKSELQASNNQKIQKINVLTVQIIERDIAANKNAERLAHTEKELQQACKKMFQMQTVISELSGNVIQLEEQKKEQQKLNGEIAERLQTVTNELCRLYKLGQQYKQDLYVKEEQIQSLKEQNTMLQGQVAGLKVKMVEHIESELTYVSKIDDLTHVNKRLSMLRQNLEYQAEEQESKIKIMQEETRQIAKIAEERLNKMAAILTDSAENADQTSKFEVLDEDFEVVEARHEKREQELKKIVEDYRLDVAAFKKRLE